MPIVSMRPQAGASAALPRVVLGTLPTPLDEAPRLAAALGSPPIWVKREDLSGLALGGNKTRQLEALMAAALAAGADTVIATAAAQSNFCRTTAAAAAKLGLGAVLLLRGHDGLPVTGNLLLDRLLGAEIEFIDTADPYDPAVPLRLEQIAGRLRAAGRRPHLIHVVGSSGAIGAAAYLPAAEELVSQSRAHGVAPAALYVTAGSGLTVAGLALGLKHLGSPMRVVGICAQKPAAFMRPLIVERANEAAALLGISTRVEATDIALDDRQIGPGYGTATPASVEAIELAARTEGLLLDPVYTGKCMAGLIADIRAGRWSGGGPVVFLHSGGTPGLFAYGADRLEAARSVAAA
ncbi:D-cysteine desulfhydrase [Rhizobiales bacterium GAS188]|nr:D-cysteine desulfhydrase [Rhizobiales bacterium GAS188]